MLIATKAMKGNSGVLRWDGVGQGRVQCPAGEQKLYVTFHQAIVVSKQNEDVGVEFKAGAWRQELKQAPWRNAESWFSLHDHIPPGSSTTWEHLLPRSGTPTVGWMLAQQSLIKKVSTD